VADPVNNSREFQRVSVDAFVKIAGADREYVFRTRDLSRSGLFLYTKVGHIYPFKVGSTLQLELYDYDQYVTCRVVVVRVVEAGSGEAASYPTGFGVRIVELADADRDRLAAMIERIAREGGGTY
jgi:hypothetical protein